MKRIAAAAALFGIVLVLSCGSPSEGLMEPGTDASQGHTVGSARDADICHGNMEALSDGVCQFYGRYNQFPENLEELSLIDPKLCSLTCPTCSLRYEYETDIEDNFLIGCPLPQEPDHGTIENGWPSWPPNPSNWQQACQGYMRSLASGCAMYYGKYNEYPEELEDLVTEGIFQVIPMCPACSTPYGYSRDTAGVSYTICCPLPVDPTHGYIINGVCYFPPDTTGSEAACHSNMCCLGSAMAMYYGRYNRYPEELSLLGTSGTMENWDIHCPACGKIYHYWTDEEGQIYLIQCPLPWDPGHGSIYDGMISW